MSKETINYSLTGEETQNLSILHKIGITLFSIGLIYLMGILKESGSARFTSATISFSLIFTGAIVFTFNKHEFSILNTRKFKFRALNIASWLFSLLGLSLILMAWGGVLILSPVSTLAISFGLLILGIAFQIIDKYYGHTAGIKNNRNYFSSLSARGILGWISGIVLTYFYIDLYWGANPFPVLISMFDSLSELFRSKPADKWFVYGTFYTFVILFLGVKFIFKYRHNRYQIIRTLVVIFSQVVLAYFIPNIMEALSYDSATAIVDGKEVYQGYYNANPINSWPLNYEAFTPSTLKAYTQDTYQPVGMAYLFWGIVMFLVITPVVTYFVGKRWYCSWFCGCGGLAETAGDSFRHLSNKSIKAWKIERWVIHTVMLFVLLMTVAVLATYLTGNEFALGFFTLNKNSFFIIVLVLLIGAGIVLYLLSKKKEHKNNYIVGGLITLIIILFLFIVSFFTGTKEAFIISSKNLKSAYGFFIGASFSGIIGVGFYPILGNRVWCRFGCPMAGYMGLIQRFKSRFRITTNGGQCISCGNCSTYCEQGIDVRAYAQKGQNIVRASCVGCGVCSAVCPRGVLKLENGPEENRINQESLLEYTQRINN
jgi:polyferredoxin